jgi:pimeloyl-ACP methyl ester carboxylesterase
VIGSTTTTDGVEIVWERTGHGSPLVLVHGFTDYRSLMATLASRFAAWHDVVSIDVRGHGDSGSNDNFSLGRLTSDIVEVCQDLGLRAPILIGHSIGALLVTGAAKSVSARVVVNIDQSLDLDAAASRVTLFADRLRNPATFHATLDAMFAGENTPGLSPALQAELDRCAWEIKQEVVLGIWADLLEGPGERIRRLIDTMLAGVTMPYLVWLGAIPDEHYLAWLTTRIPSAIIEIHPGEAHFLHLANPDRLVERVRRLIS